MNRKQRRDIGKLKRLFAELGANLGKIASDIDDHIEDGEKVKIDVDKIVARSDYEKKQEEYKEFIEKSREKEFTVKLYRKREDGFSPLIELVEEPKWLFWHGDLIRLKNGGGQN